MEQRLNRVRRLFTVTIVGLCVASMLSLLGVLYITSSSGTFHKTSTSELNSLTKGYPAVATYLREQKKSEAHFITIATLVKNDQQSLLTRAALLAALPLLVASAALGYFLARFLLRPVAEAYGSQQRFLQDAAHELRNPLATMSAVLQQARSGQPTDSQASLDILERQTDHMVHINEDLLFLERSRTQAAPQTDIAELLRDVAETMQPLASQRGVKLTVKADPVLIAMHPDDFVCLARNLTDNAIKYSRDVSRGKQPRVKLELQRSARSVVMRVSDNGIGIPTEELEHIGKRFYRAANVGRRDGSGLGFAIIRKVATDYNAAVEIASTPGKGTNVSVTFKI